MTGKYRAMVSTRRLVFFTLALLLASIPSVLFADFLWRLGYSIPKGVLLALFIILISNVAWGATHAIVGFSLRRMRKRTGRIEASLEHDTQKDDPLPPVAIAMPVYNEDTSRVMAGLKAMYLALEKTGKGESFDFFVLSDSTDPEKWVREEYIWSLLSRKLKAFGRIHYRRRNVNTDKKAGNLLEFCQDWGRRYRYMITLDADSLMGGDEIVNLVRIMERNHNVGICQTAPRIVFGESFWGRLQQFSNRFYGPVFMAGLNSWQQGDGNYWGHNAIIRMAPFMDFCALPDLPGREPFGGKILSHDFVEAALMRRAGYEVWLAGEYEGSYEEGPQDIIEHAVRDRRWCQGNLQHVWLLFSRGILPSSRIHLANGILGYASSLFWLMFLVLGGILAYNRERSGLTLLPESGFANFWEFTIAQHAVVLAGVTFVLLFLPKVLGLLDGWVEKGRARGFGGRTRILISVVLETVVSALVAPIFMIYHSGFVIATMLGKGVSWTTQNRAAGEGIHLFDAFRAHKYHVLLGIVILYLSQGISIAFSLWMSPIWVGLSCAPFISVLLSKPSVGRFLQNFGILRIPEELKEPEVLTMTRLGEQEFSELEELSGSFSEFERAAVDPYVNAVRVAMARKTKSGRPTPSNLVAQALRKGAESLSVRDRKQILECPDALLSLYDRIWLDDPKKLHGSWSRAIASFA